MSLAPWLAVGFLLRLSDNERAPRGAPKETTPYFFGLKVQLNADQRSGIFYGRTELDAEGRVLLLSNRMYIDIHTVQHGPGEVRDQWRPLDPSAAAKVLASVHLHGSRDGSVRAGSCH